MKLILIPDELSNLDAYIDRGCEGIIIGLKDLSTNYEVELDLNQIKLLREKYPDIEIFVSMNKNFFNEEMDIVEKSLIELDKVNINGVLSSAFFPGGGSITIFASSILVLNRGAL